MAKDEFSFIHQYFANLNPSFNREAKALGLELGVGDDCALLKLDGTYAITTDSLVEGTHFFSNCSPTILGARSLEVNFSDLYAMGALPQFVTLALEIPDRFVDYDRFWEGFSQGFEECLKRHKCALIGGNITHSTQRGAPLTINITAIGKLACEDKSLRRNQAQVGDLICVVGSLGFNGLFVKSTYNNQMRSFDSERMRQLEQYTYKYDERMREFVPLLVKYSSCGIDVSDGLLGDLSHILQQSKCKAILNYETLPIDPMAKAIAPEVSISDKSLLKLALTGGGDYNLVFTISPENKKLLDEELKALDHMKTFRITQIGEVIENPDAIMGDNDLATNGGLIVLVDNNCQEVNLRLGQGSYNHFLANNND